MEHLSIDLETFSDIDITKAGLYRYVQSPAFEILLFAYSIDFGPVKVISLAEGEQIPSEIIQALTDNNILKRVFITFVYRHFRRFIGNTLTFSRCQYLFLHNNKVNHFFFLSLHKI